MFINLYPCIQHVFEDVLEDLTRVGMDDFFKNSVSLSDANSFIYCIGLFVLFFRMYIGLRKISVPINNRVCEIGLGEKVMIP